MDTVEELFARFATHGDVHALAEVFDRSAPALLRLSVQLCGREAEAEDLLQATFLIAIEKARSFDPTRPLTAWLVGILQKQQKSLRRRLQRPLPIVDEPPALDPGEHVAAGEVQDAVRAALLRVDEPYRQALHLRLLDGLSTVEIAARLQRTPGAVRVQLHRGLARIRRLLPTGLALGVVANHRGLAAVRAEVLAAASVPAAVGIGVLLEGGLFMKKSLVALVVVLLSIGAWCWWPEPVQPERTAAHDARGASGVAAGSDPVPAAGDERRVAAAADVPPAEARDDRKGSLLVRLTYADNGEPAADVPVLVNEQRGFLLPKRVVRTTAGGSASFAGLAPGSVAVSALDVGLGDIAIQPDAEAAMTRTVKRGFRVFGRVVDEQGAPVPGAHIYERQPAGRREFARTTTSDGDGRFELSPVSELVSVGARAAGGRRSPFVSGMPASDRTIRVELVVCPVGADLAGRVVDERGEPIAGARLRVEAPTVDFATRDDGAYMLADGDVTATTTADGRFELLGLPAGSVRLQVASPDHEGAERAFELAAGQWHETTIVLARGCVVTGRITDVEGHAIAGAYAISSGWDAAFADHHGDYRLPGHPSGSQRVTFTAPGHRREVRTLVLVPGQACACDVTLVPEPTITGRVVDAAGAPVSCGIDLMPAGAGRFSQQGGRTDAEGRFAIPSPAGATWQLRLRQAGSMCPIWGLDGTAVASGTKDLVVTLGEKELATAWLVGRLVDDHGDPVRCATVGIAIGVWRPRGETSDVVDGSFRIGPLPPAEYQVVVSPRQAGLAQTTLGPFPLVALEVRDLGTVALRGAGRLLLHKARRGGGAIEGFTASLVSTTSTLTTFLNAQAETEPGQAVAPGQYRLHAHGLTFLGIEVPVVIRSGETTRLELALEPAERRQVRYPVPKPPGWSAVKQATVEIWRSGELVFDDELAPASEPQQTRNLALGIGTYLVRIVGDGAHRYEGTFTVTELLRGGPTIDVAVSEVR